jgi:hypothetical protein
VLAVYEDLLRSRDAFGLSGHGPGLTPADLEIFRLRHKGCF